MSSLTNHFEKYKDKGLTGLANIGNTCYLNSCMQILSHTYELNDFLDDASYKSKINKKPDSVLLLEWDKLREMMWSGNCTIAPYGFVKAVQQVSSLKDIPLFTGHEQNDIEEFLLFIIDSFHSSLSREVDMQISGNIENPTDKLADACYKMMKNMYSKEYSEMLKLFYGIHVSEISSMESGEQLSLRPEPFSVLNLSLPESNDISLLDCINLYCKREELLGDNQWFNDKTNKKEDVYRGIIFWSLPEVLIIGLKRWGNNGGKITKNVDIPFDLDLSSFVKGYNATSYKYELYGVYNHWGGSFGGHYTGNILNANGKWYTFNDTNVIEIAENNVISVNSYCLFYRKKK